MYLALINLNTFKWPYRFWALVLFNSSRQAHHTPVAVHSHANWSDGSSLPTEPSPPSCKAVQKLGSSFLLQISLIFLSRRFIEACSFMSQTSYLYVRVRYGCIEPRCLFCTYIERLAPQQHLFELACRQPVMLEDGKTAVWGCWLWFASELLAHLQ